jgi:predicted DsbA family dithiol-disulfide isomerase
MAHLRQVADGLGLPLGDRRMTYNSRLAQELGKWAESMGKGNAFHNAMFRAYFVDGLNIGKTLNLVKVAESMDLSGKDALNVIRSGAYKEAVDSDWKRSVELKVRAVPTFLYNRQVLVGAQPYEALKKLVMTDNIKRKEV